MVKNIQPNSMRIDLNQFKLHIDLKDRMQLTLHFDSSSRRFYLSIIALVVYEMKREGKVTSIPLDRHLDLLRLLNETIGGSAGSSEKKNLLPRIYRKWKDALPNLEEAPLFKVLGKKKEYEEGVAKTYSFTKIEKDGWANLFEYRGSEENVRLRFAIDKIGTELNDVKIMYEDFLNDEAWERFISNLRDTRKIEPENVKIREADQTVKLTTQRVGKPLWFNRHRQTSLIVLFGVSVGIVVLAIWWLSIRHLPQPGEVTPTSTVEAASKDKMAFPLPDKPSIAVLPFVSIDGDKEQEYFADGLVEEIINALSKAPQVFVIARQSSFYYKGKTVNVRNVAETLGVHYVLEGSVRRSANKVRVTAQLIDALKGHHLWSERYDRTMKDKFTVQDEITMKVLTELRVKLTEGETARVYSRGTNNLQAYVKVLEGNGYVLQNNSEANTKALKLYREAIELDPTYTMAYARLARTMARDARFHTVESPNEVLSTALKLARKAVELDSSLAEAHAALSFVLLSIRRYDEAMEAAKRAVNLNPESASALFTLAQCFHYSGKWGESIPLLRQAIRLNPLATPFYSYFGAACRETGKYAEGIAALKKSLKFAPNDLSAHIVLVGLYMYDGQEEEARVSVSEIMRIDPNFSLQRFSSAQPWQDKVDRSRLLDALKRAGLP